MLEECHLATGAAELLKKQNLIGVLASQAIGAQHGHEVDGSVAHGIAQGVEPGAVEAAAAVSFVPEDMLVANGVTAGERPAAQCGELAVDGLVALLPFGGDAGVEGGSHGKLTLVCGWRGSDGSARRRR